MAGEDRGEPEATMWETCISRRRAGGRKLQRRSSPRQGCMEDKAQGHIPEHRTCPLWKGTQMGREGDTGIQATRSRKKAAQRHTHIWSFFGPRNYKCQLKGGVQIQSRAGKAEKLKGRCEGWKDQKKKEPASMFRRDEEGTHGMRFAIVLGKGKGFDGDQPNNIMVMSCGDWWWQKMGTVCRKSWTWKLEEFLQKNLIMLCQLWGRLLMSNTGKIWENSISPLSCDSCSLLTPQNFLISLFFIM